MLGDHRIARLNRRGITANDSSIAYGYSIDRNFERTYSNRYPSSSIRDLPARVGLTSIPRSIRDSSHKPAGYKTRSISGCNSDTEIANGATNNVGFPDSDSSSKLSVNRWRVGGRRSLSSYSSGEEDNYSASNFPLHYDNTKDVLFDYVNSHQNQGSRQNLSENVYYEPSHLSDHSYFSSIRSTYGNFVDQSQSKERPIKLPLRSETNNVSHIGSINKESVKNLRAKGSNFSIKDWELAQFNSKIDVNEFRHLSTEHTDGFLGLLSRRSSGSMMPAIRGCGFSGLLIVHLIAGVGLNSSHSVIRDLYCVLETDALRKARSMIRTSTECFEWDEIFEIELLNNTCLSFLIYQWDPRLRHRLCFYGNITLESLISRWRMNYVSSEKLVLQLEPKGLLYFEIQLISCEETFQRFLKKNIDTRTVFGVCLKELILIEHDPTMIPMVLRLCVEEVDFRGLEVVGVYRLSGSIKMKIQLKEMFDQSTSRVNISADAVPDIHAITSVLKDFLRELPEPLFTDAFYQMIINAHELHKSNTASGEKLMLNILDCLPVENQNVLLFLMDHLMRVLRKAEVNKMDEEALSNIFGPLLFYPSPQGVSKINANILDPGLQAEIFHFILKIWPHGISFGRSVKHVRDNSTRRSRRDGSLSRRKHQTREPNEDPANIPINDIQPESIPPTDKLRSHSKHRTSKSRERHSRAHEVVVSADFYGQQVHSSRSKSRSDRSLERKRSQSRGRSQHRKSNTGLEERPRQNLHGRDRNHSRTRSHMPYS